VGPQLSAGIPLFDFGTAKKAEARAELSKQWNAYIALAIKLTRLCKKSSSSS